MMAASVGNGIYDVTVLMAVLGKAGEDEKLAILGPRKEGGLYHKANRALGGAPVQQLVAGMRFSYSLVSDSSQLSDDQRVTAAARFAWGFLALFPVS